jgi:hypothetical protein
VERERRLMVGCGCFAVCRYKGDGWVNGPGPERNENWISVFSLIFSISAETKNKLEEIHRGLKKM